MRGPLSQPLPLAGRGGRKSKGRLSSSRRAASSHRRESAPPSASVRRRPSSPRYGFRCPGPRSRPRHRGRRGLMVKELRPKRETWLSTTSFSPGCEARLKEHSAATSGVPSFHCPPRVSLCVTPAAQEQPMARLVAPAEVGRVVDDAGGVAVAPLDGHLVTATQRHGAALDRQQRWPPGSWTAYRPPDRPGPPRAHWRRRRPPRAASCGAPGRARSPRR